MRCCVQNCHSDTRTTSKSQGTTFHIFPKDPIRRAAWTKALALTDWEPTERSTVCSEHFRDEDYYETRTGLRRLRKNAVPAGVVECKEELDVLAALRVCRICLAMDSTMSDIRDRQLDRQYEQITGIFCGIEDGLPQRVCWECDHRLRSAVAFRNKAIRAHCILAEMLQSTSYITLKDITAINRTELNLRSTLTKNILNGHNLNIHNDRIIKPEYNNEGKDCTDNSTEYNRKELTDNNFHITDDEIIKLEQHNDTDNECGSDYLDNGDEYNDNGNNDNEEGNVLDDEVKFEVEYLDDSEDDDKRLSEIYPNVTEKRHVNLKKRRFEEKREDFVKAKIYRWKLDKKNPTKRIIIDDLDENLFTVTSQLTHEEQVAEMEKRKESAQYKNAPFKCTVCFKSFVIKENSDAHALKHSEKSGAHKCVICKTYHETSAALRNHFSKIHRVKYTCKTCPFKTSYRFVAKKHAKWHAGFKYECPHCPTTFEKSSSYLGHLRLRHASNFVCELCGFTFISQKGVLQHKYLKHKQHDHNSELSGPYCELCKVKFVSEEAHSRHLKLSARHTSEYDPERIRNEPKVNRGKPMGAQGEGGRRPRGSHGGSGAVTCEQCGVQLGDFRLYACHFKQSHPNKIPTKYPKYKKPCMCEQCGKVFPNMATLKNHRWIHTGEKCFSCARCDKTFSSRGGLKLHEKHDHSTTRPAFDCRVCGKVFAYINNMKRHMLIHSGVKAHECEACGKCFTTAPQMRAHYDHVHLKKPWPQRPGRHRRTGRAVTED